jgi:hypothetical protein
VTAAMYKFDPKGEPVDASFRAIALDQFDDALADLDKPEGEGRSVVHEAHRRCKKLRGLLRLVRPAFPGFATENAAIRDAAALLSHLRDAEVQRQTVADLDKWRPDQALQRIVDKLAAEPDAGDQGEQLVQFRAALQAIRDRVAGWQLTRSGRDALLPGLRKTYRGARRRMASARRSGLAPHFHEWRKANKNHGFHIDLLKRSAPDVLPGELDATDRLSTLLGLHHDLTVLREALDHQPGRFGEAADLAVLAAAIEARRSEIEQQSLALGRQVNAERPRALRRRFAAYWKSVP